MKFQHHTWPNDSIFKWIDGGVEFSPPDISVVVTARKKIILNLGEVDM